MRPIKKLLLILAAAVLVSAGLGAPAQAEPAAALPWGGFSFNDQGPATILLVTRNGNVTVRSLQLIMACNDTSDGTESSRAFSIGPGLRRSLNRNRFNFNFVRDSGGRTGEGQISGLLRSNGRGFVRVNMTATGIDSETDQVIERCQASVRFQVRRGG